MSEIKNIDEIVKEYIEDKDKLIDCYENKIKKIEEKCPIISLRTYYDNRNIENTPLKPYICDTIKGVVSHNNTYKEHASVVFDSTTYNFHIFPSKKEECTELITVYSSLLEKLKQYSDHLKTKLKIKDVVFGKGRISALSKIDPDMPNGMFKYLGIIYNNQYYSINFMRYTCNNNVVGCTMREIQFHKATYQKGARLNCDANGNFKICYTEDDSPGISKTIPANLDEINKEYTSVCFNPPVKWPRNENGEWDNKEIKKIIDIFVIFVEKEGDVEQVKKDQSYIVLTTPNIS